ncbi:hypothetical protein Pmar_PMAR019987 [Perkinsus marinus ATCC 50983]|uniref:Uncharacterized protein n=1 Tax=Perkinsus marinus (strain ATCC 50983 / TXsc) TaxID=423536 RepID=C5LJ93_PERM5|nr:hypothetical protein Pmar_PMAR019987 [Perkinsus marinus ATCC 50983]EER03209.1 hypothetical protein Pmar_PMAR019987 [Perkinsus marinus ATCC 50983]|eukprot:XP_002771393.1 hypothetical protein Pmar_PMAR019987 [Perkinsus marinus ATCC 50983]
MPPIRGQNVDGNGMNFMEVVFENMRDLGEPDVEIIRVNRILEENYFDTAESFATTTPDIWDALCLPQNVMEAVMREITMEDRGVDKEWERRRQEAARRGEEKRTVQLGEQAVSAGNGRGFDPGSAEKRIDSVEVVPYALKRLGDSHVSWVAVLQEAVQRLTNKNTAPGVGLFDWEYETRSAGVGGEKLEEEESPNDSTVKTEEFNSEGLGNAGVRPEDEIGLWQSTVTVPQLQKEFTSDWKNCKKDSQNDACFKLAAFLDSIGVPQANENPARRKSSESDRTPMKYKTNLRDILLTALQDINFREAIRLGPIIDKEKLYFSAIDYFTVKYIMQ